MSHGRRLTTAYVAVIAAAGSSVTVGVRTAGAAGTASITIVLVSEPFDGQDFSFTTTGGGLSSFILDDDSGLDPTRENSRTFTGLNAGTYTVTQAAVSGWAFVALDCTVGTGDTTLRKATIVLAAGEESTCVLTNSKVRMPVTNGTVELGLQAEGQLNIPWGDTSVAGSDYLGVRYLPENLDGSSLWVIVNGGSTTPSLWKVNPATNGFSTTGITGAGSTGLAFDGTSVWVANSGSNSVSKINATTNAVTATVTVGTLSRRVAFDGADIWVSNDNSGTLSKLRP